MLALADVNFLIWVGILLLCFTMIGVFQGCIILRERLTRKTMCTWRGHAKMIYCFFIVFTMIFMLGYFSRLAFVHHTHSKLTPVVLNRDLFFQVDSNESAYGKLLQGTILYPLDYDDRYYADFQNPSLYKIFFTVPKPTEMFNH